MNKFNLELGIRLIKGISLSYKKKVITQRTTEKTQRTTEKTQRRHRGPQRRHKEPQRNS
jgi:hypothetical protein